MTLVFKDRVMETSFTKGTGAYQLNGAIPGYQTFVAVGDGNTCYYAATDGIGWEVGEGTYSNTARTLSRDTILASSNAGSAVSWLATPKSVWVDFPAALASYFGAGTTGTGALVLQDSPELTGTPTAPTASVGTNTTQIATTAFVLANGGGIPLKSTVADVTATDYTKTPVVYLLGREFLFEIKTGNFTAEIAADTQNGIYIPTSDDPTGASRAWVLQYSGPPQASWFGFVPGSGTDAQLACAIAVAALQTPPVLQFQGGTYSGLLAQADFSPLDGLYLLGNITLDFSTASNVSNFPLGGFVNVFGAALVALPNLGADVAQGDTTLTFSTNPSLSVGQDIVIYNPTDYSYSPYRSYYKAGEWCRVADGTGGTSVQLWGCTYAAYAASAVDIYLHPSKTFFIEGGLLHIVESQNSNLADIAGFMGWRLADSDLSAVRPTNSPYAGMDLEQCLRIKGSNYVLQQALLVGATGNFYGLVLNGQDCEITGQFYGGRHGFTSSGETAVGEVVNRNLRIHGTFENHDVEVGIPGADWHGNTEYCLFDGQMIGGVVVAGNHNTVKGNIVVKSGQDGVAVYATELSGCTFDLSGVTITNPFQTVTRAVIYFDDLPGANTAHGGYIDLSNIKFDCPHTSKLIQIFPSGYVGAEPVVVDVRGSKWAASDATLVSAITIQTTGSPPGNNVNTLLMDGFYNGPNAPYACSTVGKIRGWRQTGTITLTPASTSVQSASNTATINAPKAPKTATMILESTIGGSVVTPYGGAATATSVAVAVRTAGGSNFLNTTAGTVDFIVSLDE
jgi:hypothetical protein